MRRKCAFVLFMALVSGSAARADSSAFSYDLALIVGSAAKCGFVLDDDAVSTYVAKNVPGSDLDFAANFDTQTGYHRRETEGLAGLELRLRCEAARRSAAHLGLLAL